MVEIQGADISVISAHFGKRHSESHAPALCLPTNVPDGTTNADLWKARQIKEAAVHPQTGEIIPLPFRFAAFAPVNIFLCSLLLHRHPVVGILGQVVNQSYNVCVNYCNRNVDNSMDWSMLAKSYCLAVGTSCGIAMGMKKMLVSKGGSWIGRAVGPYAAVVAAGCLNLAFVRNTELVEGVEVRSEDGTEVYGRSVEAGKIGIAKCCAARAIWSFSSSSSPLIMAGLQRFKLPRRYLAAAEVAIIAGVLLVVVPPALAVYPEYDTIEIEKVEASIQQAVRSKSRA